MTITQCLECLPRLKVLDVSSNVVEQVAGLEGLHQLQDLWLNDNRIASLQQLQPAARSFAGATLTCLYISGNPCMSVSGRATVLGLFPNLQQLDDQVI